MYVLYSQEAQQFIRLRPCVFLPTNSKTKRETNQAEISGKSETVLWYRGATWDPRQILHL